MYGLVETYEAKIINLKLLNFILADSPQHEITADHLDRLEAVKIILDKHDSSESKQMILLLLQNDHVQVLSYRF